MRESDEQKAERNGVEEMNKLKWQSDELARRPKGDPRKVAKAARLRKESAMTLKRIAQRLNMGTWTNGSSPFFRGQINENRVKSWDFMFEFNYSVDLVVVHPQRDLTVFSRALGLVPDQQSQFGADLFDVHGKPRGRKASLSTWRRKLHEEELLDSGQISLDDFLISWAEKLEIHSDLIRTINDEGGEVQFQIGWHVASSYTTGVLNPKMLLECGDLGIGLEIDIIAPQAPVSQTIT